MDKILPPRRVKSPQAGSRVDRFSEKSYREMRELMKKVASSNAKAFEFQSNYDVPVPAADILGPDPLALKHTGSIQTMSTFLNIAIIGHPFIQFDVVVNKEFLKKYDIKMGNSYVMDRESAFLTEFMEFVDGPPSCSGDGLKTAEAAQWILFYPKTVAFLGACPGNSDQDEIIYCLQESHLTYKLDIRPNAKTSYHLILRDGKSWSEVYIFDTCSAHMTLHFVDRPRVLTILERAQLIFICGRSVLQMNKGLSGLAYYTSGRFKTLCMQICEGIDLNHAMEALCAFVKYLDYLFLSKKKAIELIKVYQIRVSRMMRLRASKSKQLALTVSDWVHSISNRPCCVILYDGIKKAYVVSDSEKHKVKVYPSKFYNPRYVVDLVGYESAFSGGFLAQMVQRSATGPCIDCAFFCASAVATQMGSHFPINRLELYLMWQKDHDESKPRQRHRNWKHIFANSRKR
ncbi:hypothetical protein EGW08_003822 [Elysia chlorotica]|uniref:adenosine kinase n=1 Tax=Elysia chlorotica TaxID=188477 RepID=A0A3S0ZWJ2_ELYCH|nr:hypothetical protein EGW08_003822 [Elysia chlorotica]